MNKSYPDRLFPHHIELPDGIISDFLTTEEVLLAQLKWAFEQHMAVMGDREAHDRYEESQCRDLELGMSFPITEDSQAYRRYRKALKAYAYADKAYKDFLVKEGRTYPLQSDPTLIVKKNWGECGTISTPIPLVTTPIPLTR